MTVGWLALAACAGKSGGEKSSGVHGTRPSAGGANGSMGGSAASGSSGSGVSATSGCEYNGVHYELGESFGACGECTCTPTGGVLCSMACGSGVAGSGMNDGGRGGIPSSGGDSNEGGRGGTSAGGKPAGGMSGSGAAVSAGVGGDLGNGGEPNTVREDCDVSVGQVCIVGTPRGGGHELTEGMSAVFSIKADGCYSSSCTELASASCNTIGSPQDFYINGFLCVNVSEGGACTKDCGGTPEMTCDIGEPLTAGEYTVHVSGGGSTPQTLLRFTVPGVLAEEDRCTHPIVQ